MATYIINEIGIMQSEGSPIYAATKHAVHGYTRSMYVSC